MEVNVDLGAVRHNFGVIKARSGAGVKICAMVKADAYGHGLTAVAGALDGLADYFGVATDGEAAALRGAGIAAPVLVTGALNSASVKILFDKNITQAVCRTEDIKLLEHWGAVLNKRVKVHIKVDTGMNRLGFKDREEFARALETLSDAKNVVAEGIFTHFATADCDAEFMREQNAVFGDFVNRAEAVLGTLTAHSLASAGIFTAPELARAMVRPGLALYGFGGAGLIPAMSVSAKVICVKEIKAGESVGYGKSYTAERGIKAAVIRAGYGDGYPRALGNKGVVLINGKKCPVIGRVCMDMTTADISNAPDVKEGDTAVLMGREGKHEISAEDLAGLCGTISYEIMCNFKRRREWN